MLAYRRLSDDAYPQPIDDGERRPVDLRASRRDGEVVAWIARFTVQVRSRRFIEVHAGWADDQGCDDRQDADWSFRLRRE